MPRRASRELNPLWPVTAVLLVAAVIGGAFFFFGQKRDPYRTLESLDPSAYLDNANSLRGNVYKIEGTIQNSLSYSPEFGRLFHIDVGDGRDIHSLPVLIPAALNHVNVQKGQRFYFKVSVEKNGILLVQDMEKS
jgi:hypothetical protein